MRFTNGSSVWCVRVLLWLAVLALPMEALAGSIKLAWDASPDSAVRGYVVYVGTDGRGFTDAIDVGSATAFTYETSATGLLHFAVASYTHENIVGSATSTFTVALHGDSAASEDGSTSSADVDTRSHAEPAAAADKEAPSVWITTPTTDDRFVTDDATLVVGGGAADDRRVIAVFWFNDRGGNGNATGTDSWLAGVPVYKGKNVITITGVDASGNHGSTILTIQR